MTNAIHPRPRRQSGAVLVLALLIVVLAVLTLFTLRTEHSSPEREAERKTAAALAAAKAALLGYAASDANRPGNLPCADIDDDGELTSAVDLSCKADVMGRLPWKLLRISDLRDGSGERLWYAFSGEFRAALAPPAHPLNSKSVGQISIRTASGTLVYDAGATPSAGVVAVIFAPGIAITRQGGGSVQDRSCNGGAGCTSDQVCLGPAFQAVPKCNPVNYLDVLVGVEDNASFMSGTSDGFLNGPVPVANSPTRFIVNDRVAVITQSELFAVIKKRIFGEIRGSAQSVANCPGTSSGISEDKSVNPPTPIPSPTGLVGYASQHGGYYPWAADAVDSTGVTGKQTGYLPINDLAFGIETDNSKGYCQGNVIMTNQWEPLITYTVSNAYAPGGVGTCANDNSNCLTVNGRSKAIAKITIDGTDFGIWE